jgi:hypothetical protein
METQPKKTTKFGKGNPGKPKGAVNKNTAEIKDMIRQALDKAGGVEYLVERAQDPKTASAFLGLVGKVLPMTLVGDADNPVNLGMRIEFVNERPTP